MYRKFIDAADELEISPQNVSFMNKMMTFLRRRRDMLTHRNVLRAVLFVMMNMKYYPTLRNALSDVYAMIFLK